MSADAWLHRKGIARLVNCGSNSMDNRGSALVESRGPRRVAAFLALRTVRRSPLCGADWQTIRVARTQQLGRFRWRFQFAYRRS